MCFKGKHDTIKQVKNMKLNEELCSWYKVHHRLLPFRQSRDPYSIWVSEIMAQQTRIESMLPYYERWMNKWPTIQSLANAKIEDVLQVWQGLGYYNRARKLHQGAQLVLQQYQGILPADITLLQSIPGIGFYTAGAIGSIAYGLRAPAVDGNVLRVTTRICEIKEDILKKKTAQQVYDIVYEWMENSDPVVFTQALMELGALVCLPKHPQCFLCPLFQFCQAGQKKETALYPVKKKAKPPVELDVYTYLIHNKEGELLISQDWSDGLMEGLVRLPQFSCPQIESTSLQQCENRKHVFSHRIWNMTCYQGILETNPWQDCFWIKESQLADLAMVSAHRKWLQERQEDTSLKKKTRNKKENKL